MQTHNLHDLPNYCLRNSQRTCGQRSRSSRRYLKKNHGRIIAQSSGLPSSLRNLTGGRAVWNANPSGSRAYHFESGGLRERVTTRDSRHGTPDTAYPSTAFATRNLFIKNSRDKTGRTVPEICSGRMGME